MNLLVSYVVQTDELMAVEGTDLLKQLVACLAPVLDATGWDIIIKGLSMASSADHFSAVYNPQARYQRMLKDLICSCQEIQ